MNRLATGSFRILIMWLKVVGSVWNKLRWLEGPLALSLVFWSGYFTCLGVNLWKTFDCKMSWKFSLCGVTCDQVKWKSGEMSISDCFDKFSFLVTNVDGDFHMRTNLNVCCHVCVGFETRPRHETGFNCSLWRKVFLSLITSLLLEFCDKSAVSYFPL